MEAVTINSGRKMADKEKWDWETGTKVVVDSLNCPLLHVWREEHQVSPDGEKIATIINTGDYQFTVCENLKNWENSYEKVWGLKYSPDGRLTALVMQDDGLWTLSVDGRNWNESFDYIWDTRFSRCGKMIAAAIQKDMRYGMCVNDQIWPELFLSASQFTLSQDGETSCAVAQTRPMDQADIFTYKKGCYSIAVNGKRWPLELVSVWTPVFHPNTASIAAQCRTSIYDYSIIVDGKVWPNSFSSVWRPAFNPSNASVVAPVRTGKHWALAQDGEIVLRPDFFQMWHLCFSPSGDHLAAIVAPEFGKWTVAVDGKPWKVRFKSLVYDLVYGPKGEKVAAVGKNQDKWFIVVSGDTWKESFDMAWQPVFSNDETMVAAKVEKNGKYFIVINGKIYDQEFDFVCDPVFSPDSKKILIRGVIGFQYVRIVHRL
ncbi:MAG: WD40 repeat domain-containing protein [Desulfonatronovibrio sp.]